MKTTVWYLLVICLIKVKEMVNYIFALKSMMMVVLVMIPMIFASCFLFFSKMFQNDDHPNPKLLAVPGSNMIEINPAVCSTATPAT